MKRLAIYLKIGAAATIDPDSLTVPSPGLPLHARRAAALIGQPDATPRIDRAEIPLPIVRRASDGSARRRSRWWSIAAAGRRRRGIIATTTAAPNDKVRAAAPIHPDPTVVITPGLPLNARRPAALVHHAHPALSIDPTVMAPHIVGGAGNVRVVQRSCAALRSRPLHTNRAEIQQRSQEHPLAHGHEPRRTSADYRKSSVDVT
jgi:hypothetical protein